MSEQKLRCAKCGDTINKKKDLVVTNRLFTKFVTYHKDCYKKAFINGEYTGRPINTPTAKISLAIILAVALAYYISSRDTLILLVLILSPIYYFFIWYRYERLLK